MARVLDEKIRRAVELYNRYRAPEAVARVAEASEDKIVVVFEGSFCRTCGVVDWIEDFKYVLEDIGVKAELVKVVEPRNPFESWRVGIFKIVRVEN